MKLLELIGCPFVDFTAINCNEDALTKLYLEHYHKGKKEGYTPIKKQIQSHSLIGIMRSMKNIFWIYKKEMTRNTNAI